MKSSTYFDINTKTLADFEICISVSLREAKEKTLSKDVRKTNVPSFMFLFKLLKSVFLCVKKR